MSKKISQNDIKREVVQKIVTWRCPKCRILLILRSRNAFIIFSDGHEREKNENNRRRSMQLIRINIREEDLQTIKF